VYCTYLGQAAQASAAFTVFAPVTTPPPAGGGVVTLADLDGRGTLIAADGVYVGLISSNKFASESVCNEFGTYGSKFSLKSVRNEFSNYGSRFSSYGAYNEFTSTPPRIWYQGAALGYLTKNQFLYNALDPDILFATYGCVY
jgi:hypothetical protein